MKFQVTYYDIETDKSMTKECYDFNHNGMTSPDSLWFTPVDVPVVKYKPVIISHPIISIFQTKDRGIKIIVEGYQYTKNDGYTKTVTVFQDIYEDSN